MNHYYNLFNGIFRACHSLKASPTRALSFIAILLGFSTFQANAQLNLLTPSDADISLVNNTTYSVKWARGGTTFNRVKIKLSIDGGLTFPYLLVNNTPSTSTDSSQNIVIPGLITNQARIRVTNQADSTIGDMSDNNFSITGYCWPWNTICTNNYIRNFTLNTLNNTSTCSARGYGNFSPSGVRTTSLYRGPSYDFSIKTSKINFNYGVGIWCDLNGDSDFDDADEFLYGSSILDSTFNGTITIPTSATAGTKRLRVRAVQGQLLTAGDYCNYIQAFGEIEDYTITIGAILNDQPLTILNPSNSGLSLPNNTNYTVSWSKGNSTYDRVQIKMSADGGATFPYLLVNNSLNTVADTSETIVIPGIITNQARIRVANQNDSTENDISDNDFAITGYCWPWGMSCSNNFIRNFKLNSINNTSTCAARGYINYSPSGVRTTSLYRGPVYSFSLKTSKVSGDYGVGIWCDFNDDLDFDDEGEFLFGSSILDTTFSGTITIPNSISPGTKRMRIRAVQGQLLGAGDFCTFYNAGGEIEDYTITIGAELSGGPLVVRYPSDLGISLSSTGTATATARWSKGVTPYDRVQIKLSTDGGETFPYLLVNNTPSLPTDTTEAFVVPGIITSQARIRIANQLDSTDGDISENDFTITGYCWPWNTICTNNYIRNFSLNTLNNTSTCSARGYVNNSASGANTTNLYRGPSYPFTLKTNKIMDYGVGIWCDFNGDLDFDDAGEFIYGSSTLDSTFTGSITVANEVNPGNKRLRIRAVRGQLLTALDACTYFAEGGEIEDYTISVGDILSGGPLVVRYPSTTGITLTTTGTGTATAVWSKGATTYDRVQIKMSADGGVTYPYLLVNNTLNIPTDTTESFVIPGIVTNQARIRIANQNDSTQNAISQNNFAISGYCWPYNTVCTNNYIRSVTCNTLSNTTNTCSARGYINNGASGTNTTNLYRGPSYPFTIKTSKMGIGHGLGIWCDFNNDLDFDDPGEFIYGSSTVDTSFSGSIVIPNEVAQGDKRFRIRVVNNQLLSASDACTYFNAGGEIEDYTISVGAILSEGPLVVRYPTNSGITLTSTGSGTATARWSKGGTAFDRVQIKMSTDGGVSYPYLLVNNTPSTPTDTSESFVIPGIITDQARIRIANQNDSTQNAVSQNNFAITGYCWPWNTVCTSGYISNVTVNSSLNYSSTCSARGYIVYSSAVGRTTTMQRGLSYPFSVTTSSTMAIGIWCDFNEDLDFDDPGEFLYASPTVGTSFSGTIDIPQEIPTGSKRLRIRAVSGQILTSTDACTYIPGAGEMEGYTITISQPTITLAGAVGTQCAGSTVNVAFNTTGSFFGGNYFQVQLSGPSGSFAQGAGVSVIGQGTSSPIPCYLRLSTTPGTYRIRIMAATPLPATFGTPSSNFTIRAKPSDLVATNAERCGPGTVTLTTSGCANTKWFDAADQGNQVGTGNSFTTPVLTESKIYYVTCTNAQGCQGNRTAVYATIKPLPVVLSIAPTSGAIDIDYITITGSGFSSLDSVKFTPGKKAYFTNITATTFQAKVPVGATSGPITVYTKCGNTTSVESFTPTIPFISPPEISLASGTYPTATNTSLSCSTIGVDIYYTLDGSTPLVGSGNTKKYLGGSLFIGKSLTIKAIGYRTGWTSSEVSTATYTITSFTRASTPSITPPSGTYVGGQFVTMSSSTEGSTIYYTTNGQTPQPGVNNPVKYLGPFTRIDAFVPLKAVAIADGYENSLVATSNLTISGGSTLSACSFSPTPGTYGGPQSVTITNPDPSADIYYTLDGTDPYIYNPLAKHYSGPVAINASATLKAQAFRPGFGDGPRTTGVYTIGAFRQISGSGPDESIYYTEDAETFKNQEPQSDWLNNLNQRDGSSVKVYPNPTSGVLWIDFGMKLENPKVSLFNMLGQELDVFHPVGDEKGFEINLDNRASGFYLIRVSDSKGMVAEKRVARY